MKAYDQLARVVAAERPGACFALFGDANMAFAQRLGEEGVRMVHVRHEHCAAAAAMAHARKTGDPGLVTVTCGPGLTQLMTALPAAVRAHLPMVVVAGEAPLKSAWYNQAIDQAPFVTATGAAYVPLHTPARIPQGVRDAFLQARRERRPVVVGIPFDLQEAAWEGDAQLPEPSHAILPRPAPMPPNPDDVTRAAAAVAEARRVVVMAGLGAVEAGAAEACKALAEATGGLLAETLPARGIFHDDPFNLGVAGGFSSNIARECFAEADLVIAVGCSLAWHNAAGGKLWPKARVLQIDTDPVAVSQGRRAAQMHLRADARLGAEALAAALPPRAGTPWRSAALARRIATEPFDGARFEIEPGTIDPREAVAALDAAIPRGWQLVNSSGHCSYWTAQMRGRPNAEFLTIREFGAIGNGISFAIGVAVARPGAPVVLFDGDGSLLMHVQELETILRHDLPVMIVVFNDGGYGSEFHKLRAHGLGEAGAHFGRTDLASIARGFGAEGARIDNAADIAAHVARFAENPRPTVLDLAISERVMSPVIRRAHGTAAKSA